MATRSKASKKAPGDNKDADPARPSRLRVMRRDVEEVLRSPRRGRPKLQQHKEGGGDEAEDDGGGAPARYDCAFQHEGEFAPPEMVWCKVRSHPWWPAQVFDAADASELALQHAKAGAPLVAYFWDKTFAWSDASALLPFRANFARLSGQSTIFNFVSSVDSALQEVGRRIEVGLSCACFADSIAKKQEIQNTGIREGAYGAMLDDAYTRDMFRGKPLIEYISALGQNPLAGADRLDLATAKAQLRSFNRWRGPRELPEFVFFEGIEDVAEAIPNAKRKRMEKSGADDVSSKENKSKRGGGSSHKGEALPEPAKEEGSRVTRKSSANKKTETSKDADKSEAPAKKEVMVEDNSMSSSKERKSRHTKGSAKNKKDTSRDADKRESLPEPGNEEATNEDNSMPGKEATGDTLSKERKSRISKSSPKKKKKKDTSKDAEKRESVPEPAKEDAAGEDSSTPSGGATDGTLSKKMKSKSSKSSAKKKKDTTRDADSLEPVGGSNLPDEKAVDGVLNESKSGRRLRSAQKIEEALEGLKGLNEDGRGETMKGENNDAALLKESNLGRRARSARKKDKITEDGDGLADGSAKDSASPGKKRSGRGESSVANIAPISISEHGRKKKKLSELMVQTDTPNPSTGGKGKARVKRSLPASTEKPEDPDRDTADTMKTRKRKKLDTLGDLSSQSQSLSRKMSTKAGELTGKPAREKPQTSPAVEANGEASQTRSRRAKNREITGSDKSVNSVKLNKGKKDASLEDSLSCGEMLSQLCLAARDVKKISKISPATVSFFTDFRKSLCASNSDVEEMMAEKATDSENHASSPHADEEIPETENATITNPNPSEPALADHMKDDYWADILINVEEPLSGLRKNKDKSQTSKKEQHGEEVAKELPVSVENVEEPRIESKKDNTENGKAETKLSVVNGDDLNADEAENPSLAGLVMNFGRASAVPSRSDLIKIFSQYGPVSEAKIDTTDNANCAQVIFKRRMDAEAAFGAAGKMTALGPALVSFRLTDFPCAAASGNGSQHGA